MAKNILSLTLQQLDDSGNTLARKATVITDSAPTVGEFVGLGLLGTVNLTSISLPATAINHLYLKNTHATAKITVTWTHTTGASCIPLVLGPGDCISFWHAAASSTTGITALSLQSDTINATYELFLGA